MLYENAARLGRLLTWKRATTYASIVGLLFLSAWAYSTFADSGPLTRTGEPTAGDYIAFYTAGRMLITGQGSHLYDPAAVRALQVETMHFAIPTLYDPFRNPPFFALVFAPLGLVGLLPSFALWSALNLLCLATAVWLALDDIPRLRPRWPAIAVLVLTFEPVYRGLIGGQNGAVSLLLYVLIYRAIRAGREPAAGVWAALGLFKPQLFIVFPIVFAASRRWRALAAYGLVAGVLALVSVAIVGVDGVWAWSRIILDHEGGNAVKNAYRMHSLKAFFDLLLPAQPAAAWALCVLGSGVLLVPLVRAWTATNAWSEQLPLRWALTSAIALLIDPHLLDYDVAVLVLTGLLIGAALPQGRWWVFAFYMAFTTALLFDSRLPIGDAQLQLTVPLVLSFVWWSSRRLGQRLVPNQAPITLPEPRLTPSV